MTHHPGLRCFCDHESSSHTGLLGTGPCKQPLCHCEAFVRPSLEQIHEVLLRVQDCGRVRGGV